VKPGAMRTQVDDQRGDEKADHRCSTAKVERGSRRNIGRLDIIPIDAAAAQPSPFIRGNQQTASEQSGVLTIHYGFSGMPSIALPTTRHWLIA